MSQDDLDINRSVRTILVKHWIDLGRLSVRSLDGKLWLRGSLARIAGISEELTPKIVDAIFADIKRIKNFKQCYPSLENWNNDSGTWHEVGKSKKAERQITPPTVGVFDIGSTPQEEQK